MPAKMRHQILALAAVTASLLLLLLLTAFSQTSLDYRGFAVDSNDRVYVGLPSRIDVYESNGRLSHTLFYRQLSRSYTFSIDADTLYISDSSTCKSYSLDGTLMESFERNEPYTYDELQKRSKHSFTADNNTYRIRWLGRLSVIRNSQDVLWQETAMSCFIRCAFIVLFPGWFLLLAYTVISNYDAWQRAIHR